MAVQTNGGEIVLTGMVGGSASGDGWWDPDGFSSADVIAALATVGRENPVTIRLNSGGGIATEGAAIHAAISQHKGAVTVIVEGIAASAASLIAQAGDTRIMMPGAVMMIHDVAAVTFGDAAAHEATIRALNTLSDAYAGIYAESSGKDLAEARDLMRAETWMTADEAIDAGFADAVGPANDNEIEPAAFAYGAYARAPQRLVALADARGWKPRAMVASFNAPARKDRPTMNATDKTEDPNVAPAAEAGATPAAPSVGDVAAVAAVCAEAGMTADQITAFIDAGGTLERAKARKAEAAEIRDAVARAKRSNPAITASADDYINRNLTLEQVQAALFPMLTAQAEIAGQAPAAPAAPKTSLMEEAAATANAEAKRYRRAG